MFHVIKVVYIVQCWRASDHIASTFCICALDPHSPQLYFFKKVKFYWLFLLKGSQESPQDYWNEEDWLKLIRTENGVMFDVCLACDSFVWRLLKVEGYLEAIFLILIKVITFSWIVDVSDYNKLRMGSVILYSWGCWD